MVVCTGELAFRCGVQTGAGTGLCTEFVADLIGAGIPEQFLPRFDEIISAKR